MLKKHGVQRTGIDPVQPFIDDAIKSDPDGRYQTGFAEELPFSDNEFDLAIFYLTLIDIDDIRKAIGEAVRVLRPNGTLLIANLTSFFTSNGTIGWIVGQDGNQYHPLGNYHAETREWFEWDDLRVRNWHRPLSTYMSALLENGMILRYFDEPLPIGCAEELIERYKMNPFIMMMEWQKCA